ncbi:MAG: hypothetical protein KJ666_10530 [Bacteroidetes bacterium]|nr:hypothetical protein [Bacteroidota bacterium]MBU2584763.1 hypothetical protein [Bacteroidota bacterium]
MTKHIEEQKIELLLLDETRISVEERKEIFVHLETCRLCKENYFKLKNFYEEIDSEIALEPSNEDIDFAHVLLAKKSFLTTKLLEGPKKAVKIYNGWIEITEPFFGTKIQKFVRFVRRHPKSVSSSLAFAALFLALLFYSTQKQRINDNPAFANIENQVLKVYNSDGNILWTKPATGIPDFESEWQTEIGGDRSIRYGFVGDVDGDRKNDVLISGKFGTKSTFASDTLYCFSFDGQLKWKYGIKKLQDLGTKGWKHSIWTIGDYSLIKGADNKPRLFVIASDAIYSPSKLFELDGRTGKELQSFYNPGHIVIINNADLNKDEREEIIIGGINDPYRRAFISVFDMNNISGYGPSTEAYLPRDTEKGSMLYYILFPFTRYGELVGHADYNCTKRISKTSDNGIIVSTDEALSVVEKDRGSILYTFDNQIKIINIIAGDDFVKSHKRLVREGKLNEKLNEAFFENLKNSVLYWDGDKFTNIVSMNKYYNQISEMSPR